jgi:proline dehydrogenase
MPRCYAAPAHLQSRSASQFANFIRSATLRAVTNPRYQPLLTAAVILVTAWVLAWMGMRVADHYKMTAEKMVAAVRGTDLEKLAADARARRLRELGDKLNQLTPDERRHARADQEWNRLWRQMTDAEKSAFVERTMPSGVKQMISSFEKLPEDKRRFAVTNAIAQMRAQRETGQMSPNGGREDEPVDEELQAKMINTGLKTFYSESSAQTKAEVAPLLEEMQRLMQNGRLFRR